METLTQNPLPTFENVLASLQETNRVLTEKFAETDRLFSVSKKTPHF